MNHSLPYSSLCLVARFSNIRNRLTLVIKIGTHGKKQAFINRRSPSQTTISKVLHQTLAPPTDLDLTLTLAVEIHDVVPATHSSESCSERLQIHGDKAQYLVRGLVRGRGRAAWMVPCLKYQVLKTNKYIYIYTPIS